MYKTIDICAGIGGIRRGFELTGKVMNVLSAENDKYACKTYKHLYDEDPTNDITNPDFKSLILETEYDIMLAGFPCQAFSAVGKKEGFKDTLRGTIFFHIAEIIESNRPKAFLLENVEGLITHKKGETFKTIIDTLVNKLDYHVIGVGKQTDLNGNITIDTFNKNDIVLNAKNFGLPQNRPRVYIVGFDKQRYNDKLKNIKFTKLPQKRNNKIYNDLNDILEFNADAKYYLSQGYLDTLKKHKAKQGAKGNGFGYKIVNEIGIKNPISNAILATGGSGKERNLVYDPQDKVVGKSVKGKKTPINNEGIRLMKPEEWAKLQGFLGYGFIENNEDKFSFPEDVSNTQKYKQLGNSVAIPVIEEIAKEIIKTLDELEEKND
ncbi:MAG: DNA (cytosine-5-)-methyltransferase [Methanobrevibacter sp.]|jgi:DNA (cytosine-5)-methyltransferase 1|nr:DNA (cytosine-5-)-methyltransferase [Candidatus Methanoflexus mossambicus]